MTGREDHFTNTPEDAAAYDRLHFAWEDDNDAPSPNETED